MMKEYHPFDLSSMTCYNENAMIAVISKGGIEL